MPQETSKPKGAATPAPGTRPAGDTATIDLAGDEMLQAVSARLGIPTAKPAEPAEDDNQPDEPGEPGADEPLADDPNLDDEPGADDPAAEEDEAGDEPAEGEEPEADDPEAEEDTEWTPAMQKAFDRRIGKMTRARKESEQALKGEIEELRATVQELRGSGQPARAAGPVSNVLLLDSEREIAAREAQLEQFQEWALEHWEGFTPEDGEGQSYTAAEVQKQYRAVQRELMQEIPKARQMLVARRQVEAQAVEIYPDLKNPKSELNIRINTFLRNMPELKRFPDIKLMIAHILHRETELAQARQKTKAPGTGKPAPKPAPRVPLKAAPAAKAAVPPAKKATGKGPDVKKFIDMGGGRNALLAAVEAAI